MLELQLYHYNQCQIDTAIMINIILVTPILDSLLLLLCIFLILLFLFLVSLHPLLHCLSLSPFSPILFPSSSPLFPLPIISRTLLSSLSLSFSFSLTLSLSPSLPLSAFHSTYSLTFLSLY